MRAKLDIYVFVTITVLVPLLVDYLVSEDIIRPVLESVSRVGHGLLGICDLSWF